MKPKVLIGITGGIAAYKTADIASQLIKANVDVRVIMTEAATRFVAPLTFAALTRQKVLTTTFPDNNTGEMDVIYPHLYPATEAEAFVVAPATADAIAKLAHGLGDDIVCCSALMYMAEAVPGNYFLFSVSGNPCRKIFIRDTYNFIGVQ